MKKVISAPDAVPPLPAFSQAVVSEGKVYASGSVGCDKEFVLVPGGIKPQTRAALENLEKVLKAAGSGLEHIVKANCYLSNMQRDYVAMNEAYLEFFKGDPPARTCVGVVVLPLGADIEIECIAEVP
ncbi:YjgF-like protein [Gloeophyllum trabeum ATCC 11539]|uniref:YjgF-like protein n=1 Tax=Gloeophyllum trabeum (strain ATCC 11539 / FP-39264 / Madison 617) TaxID=670483 RepID=S7Q129_GLOTA|nr:YjgF-like protein [Gloeophyllum trabeum ATCC 11539]EPQ53222.1 YjgF-like protein [Gloeophyllum trabeum ATCC 11539]